MLYFKSFKAYYYCSFLSFFFLSTVLLKATAIREILKETAEGLL